MPTTEEIIAERQKTHGSYKVHAQTTQSLKTVVRTMINQDQSEKLLSPEHAEALDMILHKIGRIVAGNANFNDHWDDIAGYAKLGSIACK